MKKDIVKIQLIKLTPHDVLQVVPETPEVYNFTSGYKFSQI